MKKIALFLSLAAAVVLFAGCANKPQPVAADTSAHAAQPAPVKKDMKGESI